MIRTMEEAMAFIYKTSWKGSQLGLSRMTELMARVGNVQKDMKFVHIAGTNGKGSTAAMLAAVLTEAGYRTGLYTSPVIHTFGERMQVDGVAVTDAELVALAEQMRPHADAMSDSPTEFERITALALLFFHEKNCDIVVLEVGMGGRLDATNVIDAPEIAVITAIGLDHMAELGNTVEKIAGEKAGIIKKNTTVICHPQEASVERVLRAKCAEENAAIAFVARGGVKPLSRSLDGQTFGYGGIKGLTLPLLGAEQLYNAAVAIEVRTALEKKGWSIPEDALRRGLAGTRWPGRFEIMRRAPVFVVDGSHNPQGIQSAADNLRGLFPNRQIVFLFGVLADKEYAKMLELLIPLAGRFIFITPEEPRALPAEALMAHMKNHAIDATPCQSIAVGVRHALETTPPDGVICAIGSLSTVGKLRECLSEINGIE